jgi:hypothetical protein
MPAEKADPVAIATIQAASGRRSSHCGGGSSLRTAIAGKTRTARSSARFESPNPPGLPCAIGVPNLIADRAVVVAAKSLGHNVRRLMYQSLIWFAVLRHEARGMGPAQDSERLQGLPDALVDGMRRDSELDRDFLGRKCCATRRRQSSCPSVNFATRHAASGSISAGLAPAAGFDTRAFLSDTPSISDAVSESAAT